MRNHTAQIIECSTLRPKLGKRINSDGELISLNCRKLSLPSDTAGNKRLRSNRRDVWREADAVMEYWHAAMKMDTAVSRVQNFGTPEGDLHPVRDPKDYWTLIAKYREVWARLMLTPAPTAREITWKRAQLKAENHKYTGLKVETIECAIADDVEFLKAHPMRQSRKRDQEQ
jgi:hypothetical protein